MLYKNIEFHNVMELVRSEEAAGMKLQKLPEKVRVCLGEKEHPRGRFASQRSTGCEMRFVSEGNIVRVFLSALEADGDVLVYKGNFFHSCYRLKAGVVNTLHLEEPLRFSLVQPEVLEGYSFCSKVWRIIFSNGYCGVFHGIDSLGYKIRPPKEDETPKLKWLAYGSSITYGQGTLAHHNSYIQQAATRLGVDVLNNGLGGSCLCEKEVADFICERNDWDFVTLEIGVNMFRYSADEFEKRVRYLIYNLKEKKPNKPAAIITIYPSSFKYLLNKQDDALKKESEFKQILRELCSTLYYDNLYLIEGNEILTNFSGMTCDLVHPSEFGHILMGENLAIKLKTLLNK